MSQDYEERKPLHIYAIKNKDENVRLQSSSGGLFSVLAENIINEDGVVYGASFDKQWNVRHCSITSKEDISKLRGSKYVQSDIGYIFQDIRKRLKGNTKVMFSGTPCQVAGLKHFLGKEEKNLTTLDFVCHGVPNPRIWRDYLDEEMQNYKTTRCTKQDSSTNQSNLSIKDISFRNKMDGWKKFRFVINVAESKSYGESRIVTSTPHWDNLYMKLFLENYILRPCCYSCKFRKGKSGADYTMGDYWGVQNAAYGFDDDKGVSLLMKYVNDTELNSLITKHCDVIDTTYESAINGNPAIIKDWPQNRLSSLFYFFHDVLSLNIRNSWLICHKMKTILSNFTRLFDLIPYHK